MKRIILISGSIAFIIILIFTCTRTKQKTNIENPIILVPGYGSKVSMWENSGLVDYFKAKGLIYGGLLYPDNRARYKVLPQTSLSGNVDVFSLAYSDSTAKIEKLAQELGNAINFVLKYTKAKKVMLISYSMGGIVSRKYLCTHVNNSRVQTLVTICSPHNGSFWANISSVLNDFLFNNLVTDISMLINVNINGEALKDLIVNSNSLKKLNNSPHPLDINYCSIIGIFNKIIESRLSLLQKTLEYLTPDMISELTGMLLNGDLVCSAKSQDMRNIDFIKNNPNISTNSEKIYGVYHLNILNERDLIYNIIERYITFRYKNRFRKKN